MSDALAGGPDWVRVAARSQLDPEFPIQVILGDAELAVGEVEGEVFAVDNICSHAFARLSDGFVQGQEIFCPLHQGSFNVRTGAAVAAPCFEPITAYPARLEGDDVLVDAAAVRAKRAARVE